MSSARRRRCTLSCRGGGVTRCLSIRWAGDGSGGRRRAKATVLAASSEAALSRSQPTQLGTITRLLAAAHRQLTGGTCENAYLSTRGRLSRGAPGRTGFSAKSKGAAAARLTNAGEPTGAGSVDRRRGLAHLWRGGGRRPAVCAGAAAAAAARVHASGAALPWRGCSRCSRAARYRRHAGELIASVAERDAMHAAHAGADDGAPLLLFAHAVSSVMSVTHRHRRAGRRRRWPAAPPRRTAALCRCAGRAPGRRVGAAARGAWPARAAPGGVARGARAVRVTGATLATLRTSDGAALVPPAGSFRPYSLGGSSPAAPTSRVRSTRRRTQRVAPLRAAAARRAAARRRRLHRRARCTSSREAALTVRLPSTNPPPPPPRHYLAAVRDARRGPAAPPARGAWLAVDTAAVSAPYDELGSLARIAWVNSRAGIHERPPPGVAPIAAQTGGGELYKAPEVHFAFERSLAVGALGLPEQITAKGVELLAAPISVRAQVEKSQVEWRASRPVALANGTAAGVRWEAEGWARRGGPQTPPLSCAARRAEYDGWVDLTVEIRAKSGEVQLQDVELRVPFRQQMSTYGLGMGFRGGRRPARWAWSGTSCAAASASTSAAITRWGGRGRRRPQRQPQGGGGVEVPLAWRRRCPRRGAAPAAAMCSSSTRAAPPSWRARGRRKVSPTKPLTLRFAPDHAGARPAERPRRARLTAVLPHQVLGLGPADGRRGRPPRRQRGDAAPGELSQPVHQLPVLRERDGGAARLHSADAYAGRRVKLYFTTKELTSWATELPLFRELGTEIVTAADTLNHRRGSSYLQEQLSNYAAAWCTHSVKGSRGGRADLAFEDQALLVNGASRWCNYYVEGVRWVLRHLKLDGIYLDGIRFPARCRSASVTPSPPRAARGGADTRAPLLDLHAGPNLRSFLEHTPYLDSLWVGENIEWGSGTPDYWLVAVSGLCWGLYSDMLGNADKEADAMRGCCSRCSRGRGGRARSRGRTRRYGRCGTTLASARPSSSDGGRQSPVTLKESGAARSATLS